MKLRTILVGLAAGLCLLIGAPAANAQGGGMRMMRGGNNNIMLLARKDVQKDLGLTEDQIGKLTAIQQGMMDDMRAAFQNGGGDREAMQKQMQEMMKATQKKVDEVLTEAQRKRLKEIGIQMQGNRAITDPEVQKALNMTDDQKTKVKALSDKSQEAMQSLMEKMRNQEIDRDEMRASMEKNNKVMDEELAKILTEDQKKALAAMGGKKFEKDPNERGFGFGGGGGL